MGNSPKNASAFTKNWRHVAPSLLRNQLTHELIEQHYLRFDNLDDQNLANQLLAKRIRIHHSHVVKLIYYAPEKQLCSCSVLEKQYRTQVYTEYPGDCLIGFLRVNQLPLKSKGCPCFSVLQGATYLHQYYGGFQVAEDRVFLDLQQLHDKQPSVKVWIHPDKAQLHPRRTCTEEQMVQSLLKLFEFILQNSFCKNMTSESLQAITNVKKLADLKLETAKAHNFEFEDEGRHKKSFSVIEPKSKVNFIADRSNQSTEIRINTKPSSLPHQQQNHVANQSRTISFNTNQKKIHFIHSTNPINPTNPTSTNEAVRKVDEINKKYDPKTVNKRSQATTSTQATLLNIISPKELHQHISEYQGSFKQHHHRVHFSYVTADSQHTEKKIIYPVKYEETLRNIKEESTNRDRINSHYQIYSRSIESYKEKSINIDNALRVIKQLQFKNGEPTLISQFEEDQPLADQKKHHTKHIDNPPQSFFTNPPNTISNSLPSVLIPNSDYSYSRQSVGEHLQHKSLKSNDSFQISQDGSSVAAFQMQLPLRQNSLKQLPAYLPTTSRSPKREKDFANIHPISQVSEVMDGKQAQAKMNKVNFNDSMFSSRKSSRKPHINSASKNQKIQRYTKEIKQYEQNIRQRLSSSTGNKKFNGIVQKLLQPETRSDRPNEFKQTKSIYNDSEHKPMEASNSSFGIDQLRQESRFQKKNRTQQSQEQRQIEEHEKELKMLYLKQQKYEREQMKRFEDQREKQKEFEITRLRQIAAEEKKKMEAELERQAREKQEKLQLQRELECERKNIQNEMNDLLRQNAMKDEYRSIREKVKQKKQTFAQLKAEAAKILEDCLY